jgi:hypothetical protein
MPRDENGDAVGFMNFFDNLFGGGERRRYKSSFKTSGIALSRMYCEECNYRVKAHFAVNGCPPNRW